MSPSPKPSAAAVGLLTSALPSTDGNAKVARLKKALAGSLLEFTGEFRRWDRDGSGSIDRHEFAEAMQRLNMPCDEESCAAVFAEFDWDGSGSISYYECMRYILLDILQGSVSRVLSLFKLWDVDCSGTIDLEEFRHGIETMGFDAPKGAVDKLFDELDELDEGEIKYVELGRRLRRPRGSVAKQLKQLSAEPSVGSTAPTGTDARGASSLHSAAPLASRPPMLQFADHAPPFRSPVLRSSSRPPSPTRSEASSSDEGADVLSRPIEVPRSERDSRFDRGVGLENPHIDASGGRPWGTAATTRAAWTSNHASPRATAAADVAAHRQPPRARRWPRPMVGHATLAFRSPRPPVASSSSSQHSSAHSSSPRACPRPPLTSPRDTHSSPRPPRDHGTPGSPRDYYTASPRPVLLTPNYQQTTPGWRAAPIWQPDHHLFRHPPPAQQRRAAGLKRSGEHPKRGASRQPPHDGPMVLRISAIEAFELPDADKAVGAGSSDPYFKFTVYFNERDFVTARTQTIMDAPRGRISFPDRLDFPLPDRFIAGKFGGGVRLVAVIWDDDSAGQGGEGVNADDPMGQFSMELHHTSLNGKVDRATFDGIGGLNDFRASFKYAAVPAGAPTNCMSVPETHPPLLTRPL